MTSTHKFNSAELLYSAAEEMGLHPSWVKPKSTFAIMVSGKERYIHEARSPLNSHTDSSLIVDKLLTRLILERHNMPNIPFTNAKTIAEAEAFLKTYGKIIAKPTHGHGSIDVHIVTDLAQLLGLDISKYILEKYIAGREMRYMVLNGEVVAVHESKYGTSVEAGRAVQYNSFPKSEWNSQLVDLAIRATGLFNLRFGVVDYMIDASDRTYILELNTGPDLKWIHDPISGPSVNIARLFLESVIGEGAALSSDEDTELAAMPILAYS